ncbi:MAG: succinyl-diaminopimelate desuccinylase [Actinomyces sp.]|nr:succinyl-diaminopimelate desuccinylase [Actinomyces sp.]
MTTLDLTDPVALTAQLVDIPSVSGDEGALVDALEEALSAHPHLEVLRDGDAVVARTHLGRDARIVIAGHTDTVPISGNVPSRRESREGVDTLVGRGSVDMKGGVAIAAHLAATLTEPRHDVTWVFYDHEEVAASLNGLGRLCARHPDWLHADLALLGEPTAAQVEGGCNGTLRVIAHFPGVAAHSARAWRGENAIHKTAPVIARIAAFGNPVVTVDGLDYRESLSVVGIRGGGANNVIPDSATMTVNYRFAPSKHGEEAMEVLRQVFEGSDASLEVDDLAEGARPGLDSELVQEFLAAAGDVRVGPKYGWTDVARFSALGIPALNFGPGDPLLAHTVDEHLPVEQITRCAGVLEGWLAAGEEGTHA